MPVVLMRLIWLCVMVFFQYGQGVSCYTMSSSERINLKEEAKSMFYHGYNNYMKHAFPWDELRPLTCQGRRWDRRERGTLDDSLGGFSLTLIDSLGTLAVLGDWKEFRSSVEKVIEVVTFDRDVDVSVFETTIRVLGGLLSAHMLASNDFVGVVSHYKDELLHMAVDLGNRLVPAFDTPTGIPRHRVNLRYGNIPGETYETCTAAGGSLLLEFALLSRLTGIPKYETIARTAVKAIWKRRSKHNLIGSNLNTATGQWIRSTSGIGAGLDSYFEYLLKYYIMFGDAEWLSMFNQSYSAIENHIQHGDWHFQVDMHFGKSSIQSHRISSLQAFWPGLQVLAGDVSSAIKSHENFYSLWKRFDALPEMYDLLSQSVISWARDYPLRPEFAESTYHLYQATKDPKYLLVGKRILFNLQNQTKVNCGYASIADVHTKRLDDRMDSFFLSETCKYLYLLFNENDNIIVHPEIFTHQVNTTLKYSKISHSQVVFSTEGHIFVLSPHFFQSSLKNSKSKKMTSSDTENAYCSAVPTTTMSSSDSTGKSIITKKIEKKKKLASFGSFFTKYSSPSMQCPFSNLAPTIAVSVISPSGHNQFPASSARFGAEITDVSNKIRGMLFILGQHEPMVASACSSLEGHSLSLAGRIAVVQRGHCSFVSKARRVQQAGATGMIVVDKERTNTSSKKYIIISDNGSGSDITIPVAMISYEDFVKMQHVLQYEENVVAELGTLASESKLGSSDSFPQKIRVGLGNSFLAEGVLP